ncbi:Uncharacterized protein DBV15_04753 [Temnothorax longispinosus]|uniref:Uncharacterized protein n=1 Tax=Temnothorax longispinosus TaxID=300112 RepID=A0A4S2L613_9HYME|nr:Uncharacterized protein DBV15_04753 [Temnothorax longispinosus]
MYDGRSAVRGLERSRRSGATREWVAVARTETRAFSPSFSPFTHTTAAGNGIANPSTLHASWQLVISRPGERDAKTENEKDRMLVGPSSSSLAQMVLCHDLGVPRHAWNFWNRKQIAHILCVVLSVELALDGAKLRIL